MEITHKDIPRIDFRMGFVKATGISYKGKPGIRHADFIKNFNRFGIQITEDTLRNWLYRQSSKINMPRWDIVFELCSYTRHSLSELLGMHRKDKDWSDLIGLSQKAVDQMIYYSQWDNSHPELARLFPCHGYIVSYVLQSSFFKEVLIPSLIKYETTVEGLAAAVQSTGDVNDISALMASKLYKEQMIRSIQSDLLPFIREFYCNFQYNGVDEFTEGGTAPLAPYVYEVSPQKAFLIGLTLAVYHKQHPDEPYFGAEKYYLPTYEVRHQQYPDVRNLGAAKYDVERIWEPLPDVDIPAFYRDLASKYFTETEKLAYSTVYGWLNGKFMPGPEHLCILCDYFSCDIDYLFGFQRFTWHEYDSIAEKIGLSKNVCQWIHKLPKEEHRFVELFLSDSDFHFLISHMQDSILLSLPSSDSYDFWDFSGSALKDAKKACIPTYDPHLEQFLTKHMKLHEGVFKFFDDILDFDDEDTFIAEYMLSDLIDFFIAYFSNLLDTIESDYLNTDVDFSE